MGKIIFAIAMCWLGTVNANVAVTDIFGSSMVLQRERAIPVWGTAVNGESVSVTLNGETRTTTASNGQWRVELPSMPAGGPFTMTIQGNNTLTFTDVMVGEVWHCAGQSNMDTRMNYWEYPNLADSIKNANYPLLRYKTMRQPKDPTKWQSVSPATVGPMSATAYFMGRELLDNLNGVAVGMVITAVGGTTIDTWVDPVTKASIPALAQSEAAGSMYNAWVQPVVGYGIRGTVWLQGENNTLSSNYGIYGEYLPKLISGWRQVWNFPEMPFIVAGLSRKGGLQVNPGENSNVASIREFQRTVTDTMPHTWLSVLVDLGEDDTWHYSQKPQAGFRLGRLARGAVYGHTGFVYEHPRPAIAFMRENQIYIPFDTRGSNLQLNGGTTPTGFAVAGANNAWSWASSAELKGDTIILTTTVANPTQIKYAWANTPIMNLTNSAGIPATPFHLQIAPEPIVIPSFDCSNCQSQLQSEEPCVSAGFFEDIHVGFAGTGYWNFDNTVGSSGTWMWQSSVAQTAKLYVRYANGGTAARPMEVFLNGIKQGEIPFASTPDWKAWTFDSVSVNLSAGRNELRLVSLTADGGPNVDYFAFKEAGVAETTCEEPVQRKSLVHQAPQLQSRRGNIAWAHLTSPGQMQVFNLQGKLVFSQIVSANSGQINTNTWQRGLYVVHINSAGQKLQQVVEVY